MARPLQRDRMHVMEEKCVRAFEGFIPPEWIFRKQQPDYGIDAEVEIVEGGNVTNKILWVQLKSVEKAETVNGKISYSIETKYVEHFLACRLPVALVLCTLSDMRFYCLFAQKYLREELSVKNPNWRDQKTVTIDFPEASRIENAEPLRKIATEGYFYVLQQQLSPKPQEATYWLDGIPLSDDQELKERTLKALEFIISEKYNQAIETLEEVFKVCTISPTERMSLLLSLGNAYFSKGSYDLALKNYEDILHISPKVETGKALLGKSGALLNMGLVFQRKNAFEDAIRFYMEALKIDHEIKFKIGESADLFNLGTVYRLKGNFDEALKFFHAALLIDREIGYKQGEADSLGYIGILCHSTGDLGQALENLSLALEIHRSVADRLGEASDLGNIGLVYGDQKKFDNSLECLQEAVSIHKEINDICGEVQDLRNIASMYMQKGDRERAAKFSHLATIRSIAADLIEKGHASVSFSE